MVTIRLKRLGKKRRPTYRIVVIDSRNPRDGKSIEELGYYIPYTNPSQIKIDLQKYSEWIKKGAQPTPTVRKIVKISEKNISENSKN